MKLILLINKALIASRSLTLDVINIYIYLLYYIVLYYIYYIYIYMIYKI